MDRTTLECILPFFGIDETLKLKYVCKSFHHGINNSNTLKYSIMKYSDVLNFIIQNITDSVQLQNYYLRYRAYEQIIIDLEYPVTQSDLIQKIKYYKNSQHEPHWKYYCYKVINEIYTKCYISASLRRHPVSIVFDFVLKQLYIYIHMRYFHPIPILEQRSYIIDYELVGDVKIFEDVAILIVNHYGLAQSIELKIEKHDEDEDRILLKLE